MNKSFLISFLLISSAVFAEPQAAQPLQVQTYEQLVSAIRQTRSASQRRVEQAVDQEKVREAWEMGKLIHVHILLHQDRADYGKRILPRLSDDLEISETELAYMLQFVRVYPISPPAEKLSWGHYRELLSFNDDKVRQEVTEKAEKEHWGRDRVREEVRKRQSKPETPEEKLTATPGTPGIYRIVLASAGPFKGELALDLGFSNYYKTGGKLNFKEGDIIQQKGTADRELRTAFFKKKTQFAVRGTQSDLFTYPAYVTSAVDGDTLKAVIDLGFGFVTEQKLRLRGLDAPEIESSEGKEAKAFLEKLLKVEGGRSKVDGGKKKQPISPSALGLPPFTVLIKTHKSDKYDRYLADVWANGKYVNQELLDQGRAVKAGD